MLKGEEKAVQTNIMMYENLIKDIKKIKTRNFHKLEVKDFSKLDDLLFKEKNEPTLEYFWKAFGGAKLFRVGRMSYKMVIFNKLEFNEYKKNELVYFSFVDDVRFFLDQKTGEIYKGVEGGFKKEASSFLDWFSVSYNCLVGSYKKNDWKKIVSGPSPFSQEEIELLKLKKNIVWQDMGLEGESSQRIFSVENRNSSGVVKWLTIGVKSIDKRLNGAIYLDIEGVKEGETVNITNSCYSELYDPRKLETFPIDMQGPEEREYFIDFR